MNKHKIESSILSTYYLISKTELFQKLAALKYCKINGFALTFEQIDLLHILYQEDDITQTELGKVALKDKANVARIIGILEKKGFVNRELATHNNRMAKKVFITEAGRNEIDKIMPIILAAHEKIMEGISEEQIENLKTTLEIYRRNIEKHFDLHIEN